ncbi:MAG: glutamate--tRNA ligase [Thermoplasmata archaeon]
MALDAETALRLRRIALENAVEHGDAPRAASVVGRLLAAEPGLRARAAEIRAAADAVVAELAALSPDERAQQLAAAGGPEARPAMSGPDGTFPELPGAVRGQVVLRLAPFPSGALHIGNGRMLFVNELYRQRYAGRLLLVFDDTIGSEEKRVEAEFFEMIRGDLELAGIVPDATYYKSDRLEEFYAWARRTIAAGGAYVCHCPAELLRENRVQGRACAERSQTPDQTLGEWDGMLAGRYAAGEAVLRLRTSMTDPDPAFRDRVLFRLSDVDHPRVGRRYRVWPMLEFSWAVDDVLLGVTHVLRGLDLVIEDRMEEYLWNLLGLRGPRFVHWGLLRIREAKLSKSKSYREVKDGTYDGWDDPRTWSLRSLDRRGIRMEALRRFTLSFGLSPSDIEVPAETLYAENRRIIDAETPRRAYVPDPIRVDVRDWPDGWTEAEVANHPDRPELGRRRVAAGPSFYLPGADLRRHAGGEVRLKDLANLRLPPEIPPGADTIEASFTGAENRRLPRLQWVGIRGAVPVEVLGVMGERTTGQGEAAIARSPPRACLQFERVGFVRLDRGWETGAVPVRAVYGHP